MKDQQAPPKLSIGGIPILSPLLHLLSMPVLVFLRFNFGYAFLSPKSIFLAIIFACCLFTYVVWHEPTLAADYASTAVFMLFAGGLYLIHLSITFIYETRRQAQHDQYSGKSWLLLPFNPAAREQFEAIFRTTVEPFVILIAAVIFYTKPLGKLLVIFAVALSLKELVRTWLDLRRKKRVQDNIDDAKDSMEFSGSANSNSVSATGRTQRERFERNQDTE